MSANQTCIIIGASHAGVNCAFSLRKEGWEGKIVLFDADPNLPYHRPPLSKAFLVEDKAIEEYALKSEESYRKSNIDLRLGVKIDKIDQPKQQVEFQGKSLFYDKLVIATGAQAFLPPIDGLEKVPNVFPLRNMKDAQNIRQALDHTKQKRVVVIGGGYIGLEIAASLRKLGASVSLIEREQRLLSRVAVPELSHFFQQLHETHGVKIYTAKQVSKIDEKGNIIVLQCADGTQFEADIIVVGVGIRLNLTLVQNTRIDIKNGIVVDESCCTSDQNLYAIGDCSYHYNIHYDRHLRLESVQNAVDQAKVAAASICGKNATYDRIPWFWSDQYNVKWQMVGLSEGFTEMLVREEDNGKKSFWYFKGEELLAVDAINSPKAYILGMKFIKQRKIICKRSLINPLIGLKPANLLKE